MLLDLSLCFSLFFAEFLAPWFIVVFVTIPAGVIATVLTVIHLLPRFRPWSPLYFVAVAILVLGHVLLLSEIGVQGWLEAVFQPTARAIAPASLLYVGVVAPIVFVLLAGAIKPFTSGQK